MVVRPTGKDVLMGDVSVLAIDHDAASLEVFKKMLDQEAFGVVTATDTKEALDIIGKEKIKVLVSSYSLCLNGGRDLFRRIEKSYPNIVRILSIEKMNVARSVEGHEEMPYYQVIHKPWREDEVKLSIIQGIKYFDLAMKNENLLKSGEAKMKDLEKASRKVREMFDFQKGISSTISHELRTPLASIKMAIEIVLSGSAGSLKSDQRRFLGKAIKNIDRLKRLIDDVLDLSKLESGHLGVNKRLTDINRTIQEVADVQEAVAKRKKLYMKSKLNAKIPLIRFDEDRILQVLNNIIHNAIKFTSKGGITVSSNYSPRTNYVEICVKDTGEGVDPEDIHKLFKKYKQLGDPAYRKTGGTGLGLAICHEILQQHGGKIWMDSRLGKGSSVHFLLPVEERRKNRHV